MCFLRTFKAVAKSNAITKAGIENLSVPNGAHAMIWEMPAITAEWIAKAAAKLTKDGLKPNFVLDDVRV
ncbi:hypothetical protein [Campylobacter curvus]|uniref:hypothetical protein n=1 Tax=Campylobacter curvus TaxID=200 RepID=UPI001470022E|nr:hypothetical protein [Campylobacter curvus]